MRREGPAVSCSWTEARFSAAFDESLSAADRGTFDGHLASCEACRRGYREFAVATRALRSYEPPAVPRTFIDSVREAVTPVGDTQAVLPEGPRRWPTALAWGTAAAALVIAGWALLTRAEPTGMVEVVEVPVIREVAVERAVPLAIPVRGEGLSLVRDGEIRTLKHGETVELRRGDRLLALEPPAPVRLAIDVRPLTDTVSAWLADLGRERRRRRALNETRRLADALVATVDRMTDSARFLAEAAARAAAPEGTPTGPPSPRLRRAGPRPRPGAGSSRPAPARVMLVPKANEVLVLETSGSASEVIPELIGLLEDEDARVAALARARLEEIQQRLTRAHGIRAPVRLADPGDGDDGNGGLARWFGASKPRAEEPSPGERWRSWWDENREPIRLVSDARTE